MGELSGESVRTAAAVVRTRTTGEYFTPMRELFERFRKVRVISLPDRKDRRAMFERHVRQARLDPSVAFRYFNAIRCKDAGPFRKIGSHGAMLSHLAVLREGGPVLILQDDCKFMATKLDLIEDDVDIFYGSHSADAPEIIGAHCMGFSARAARLAADYLEAMYARAIRSEHPYPFLPPIDGLLVWFRREHPQLRTHFQLIATQRSSRSDVTPARFDSIKALRGLVNVARCVKDGETPIVRHARLAFP